jgi:hypothetical protein
MNRTAERHITKAKGYLAKGDEFYGRAADEMIAAREADPTVGYPELAAEFGRGKDWARTLVQWRTSGEYTRPPFSEPKGAVANRHAKAVLKDAPLEQLETIIDQLPKERQQAIAAAAKDSWMGARQERDDQINRLTPAEEVERYEAGRRADQLGRRIGGTLGTIELVLVLEQAADLIRDMTAAEELTPEIMQRIEEAHTAFVTELEFAKALAG